MTLLSKCLPIGFINGKENVNPSLLNFEGGITKTMMGKIVDQKVRDKALEQAWEEQHEDIMAQKLEKFNCCLQMTVGKGYWTDKEQRAEWNGSNGMKVTTVRKRQKQGRCNWAKSTDPTTWSDSELNAMESWFKRPWDSNIPKRKEHLLQRYLLTCHCCEEEPKWKKDDEPPVVDNYPGSIVNDPGNAAANETALEAHEGIAAALIQIAMMEVWDDDDRCVRLEEFIFSTPYIIVTYLQLL
jgi:hypothetical protein